MKKLVLSLITAILLFAANTVQAQKRPLLTVLNIDAQAIELNAQQLGNLVRLEVEKLDTFEVMDRYDVTYLVKKNNLIIDDCFGKICLTEIGTQLNSEKMQTGSVELFGETLIVTLRLIDVKRNIIERSQVIEFLNLQNELQEIIRITLYKMFNRTVDSAVLERLTKKFQFDNATTNPYKNRLNLSGPRLCSTYFNGESANIMQLPRSAGGFNAIPVMFMFGYQFEKQYLNEGNFQALFEFVPTITGVDQGLFLPNINILHGVRHNVSGWEFAIGPSFGLVKKAKGYYTADGVWHLDYEWTSTEANPNTIEERVDSRGETKYHSGFIFAAGKSFKSGKINFPVNLFIIPSKNNFRAGLTFGFNAKNTDK